MSPLSLMLLTGVFFCLLGIYGAKRKNENLEGFVAARNSIGSSTAMATVVASVLGAWILFSPAEAATFGGVVAITGYAIGQALPLLAFALVGPRMRKLMPDGHSLTEYVFVRYGKLMHVIALGVVLFYMFIFLSAEVTGIALAVRLIGDIPLWQTAWIVGLATVLYTAYGGLRASIFTDQIQFAIIIPLLLVILVFGFGSLGGAGVIMDKVTNEMPELLTWSNGPGVEFGLAVIIAIFSANMFHQGFWQRVYASRDIQSLRRGYFFGGLVVVPIVAGAGVLGIIAIAFGAVDLSQAGSASTALFGLMTQLLPNWMLSAALVLGMVLVMSSMDTLLNGMASVFTTDISRLKPELGSFGLLRSSRVLTVIISIPAIYIASKGFSVLYLFLVADMVCAAAVVPVFLGLYAKRFTGWMAVTSTLVGFLGGTMFFPYLSLGEMSIAGKIISQISSGETHGLFAVFEVGNLMYSFGGALALSTVMAFTLHSLASTFIKVEPFEFRSLSDRVRLFN